MVQIRQEFLSCASRAVVRNVLKIGTQSCTYLQEAVSVALHFPFTFRHILLASGLLHDGMYDASACEKA